MKTNDKKPMNQNTNCCNLVFYNGTLQQFATTLLANERGDGSVCRICEIHPAIVDDMRAKGKPLYSNDIIITQRQIFKYRNHPKSAKGAAVPLVDYVLIEETLRNPEHIYEDTAQNRLVYVCTHPYHENKILKVVVDPDFKYRGTIINIAKSWGIVEENKMRGIQYRLIQ